VSKATFLPGFVQRVERVYALAQRAGSLDAAMRMSLRLGEALRRLESDDPTVPVVRVVLLGGTGVGKSALFNALIGRNQASPTSDDVRCFTQQPFVAVSAQDRPLLNLPGELDPQYIDVDLGGIALIDTPDIDGALKENWHVTRSIVRRADIVVYVTMPDRRSEFQVHQELLAWASLKRWFFVLNKADQVSRVVDEVRDDFDGRLRDLGFEPHHGVRFVVSAVEQDKYDFTRMRQSLFNTRLVESVEKLRADGFLGYTSHALSEDVIEALQDRQDELIAYQAALNDRIRQAYRGSLEQPLARHAFRVVVRELAWRYLGERIGWLMGLAVWLRARASVLNASFHVARLGLGRWNLIGLARAGVAVMHALLRGMVPLQRIMSAMGPKYREEIRSIQVDAKRFLEDQQLDGFLPASLTTEPGLDAVDPLGLGTGNAQPGAAGSLPGWMVQSLWEGAEGHELEHLQSDLENLAQQTANRVGPWPLAVLTNLIPTAFAGHALYRIGQAWFHAEYLPAAFYGMAISLLLVSLLPGYILLALRMRRACAALDPAALVDSIEDPLATVALRTVRERLGEFLRETLTLRSTLHELRRELDREIPSASTVRPSRPLPIRTARGDSSRDSGSQTPGRSET
jgi:GTP-binding protein EngB required for normal cell division